MRGLLTAIVASFLALPVLSQDAEDQGAGTTDAGEEAAQEGSETAPEAANESEGAPEADADAADPADAGETAGEDEAAAGEGAGDEAATEDGDDAGGPLIVLDEEEGSVIDDQTFEGEDDDFIPTEQIPVDEPIPFPSDI